MVGKRVLSPTSHPPIIPKLTTGKAQGPDHRWSKDVGVHTLVTCHLERPGRADWRRVPGEGAMRSRARAGAPMNFLGAIGHPPYVVWALSSLPQCFIYGSSQPILLEVW